MSIPSFHYSPDQEPPFTVYIEHLDKTRDGHWRPNAFVKLTQSLRTSGLLRALPPEDLKCFLILLTFLTPNGHCGPSLTQLAAALGISQMKARTRLQRLADARWHGQPIVVPLQHGNGLDAFMPVPGLLPVQEEEQEVPLASAITVAPREAIIEHSRQHYARPRAEVERQIAEQMGWQEPEETAWTAQATQGSEVLDEPRLRLREELLHAGLPPEQADELLARFDPIRIQRQLQWLPYRTARNRAGLLIAAIKDDYEAPPALRHQATESPEFAAPDES